MSITKSEYFAAFVSCILGTLGALIVSVMEGLEEVISAADILLLVAGCRACLNDMHILPRMFRGVSYIL